MAEKTPQQKALEVLRAISKSSDTALQLDDCPVEFLRGPHINIGRWTMVVSDKNMKALSEMPREVFFIDADKPNLKDFFWDFWDPKDTSAGLQSLDINGSKLVTEYGLAVVARQFPGLKHLNIKGCMQIGDVGLRELGMNCKDLLSLNMSSCQAVQGQGLIAIAEMCRKLLKIDVSRCANLEKFGIIKIFYQCNLLEEVDVAHMKEVGDNELQVMANNCPNIVYLNATECPFISDQSLQLVAKNCRDLDYVDISRTSMATRITDLTLLGFGESSASLRVLKMSGCDQLTDVGLTWLAEGCKVIEELDFNGCQKISDAGMRSLGNYCHSLTSLDITGAKLVSDVGVASVATGCPKMRRLIIANLYLMCDPRIVVDTKKGAKLEAWQSIIGIQSVAQHLEKLEEIDISGCFRLNKSIAKFLSRLGAMKKINFSACNQVTTESLIEFARGCPLLEDITLNDCGVAVNDAAFSKGFVKYCHNLHTVVVHRCLEFRGGALKALSKCQTLVKLDISGCKSVTDMMLLPLTEVDTVPLLKTLIMLNCPLLTDTSLAWIASKTHNITLLAIRGTSMSKHSVQAVRDRFPHSDKLDNENFLGFWPKFRMEDRKIMNEYYYAKQGWIKLQARQRSWLARERVKKIVAHRRRKRAIYVLQRMCRLFVAISRVHYKRRAYKVHQHRVVLITSVFHIAKAKKAVHRVKMQMHANFIYRMANIIQCRYRIWLAKTELQRLRDLYQEWLRKRHFGATKFQSIVLVYFAKIRVFRIKELRRGRAALEERKAIIMERYWRGSRGRIKAKERKAYIEWFTVRRHTAAEQIQRKARINYTNKLVRQRTEMKRLKYRSARSIQSLIRGFICRLALAADVAEEMEIMQDGAVTVIQAAMRRKLAYLLMARMAEAAAEKERRVIRAAIAVQNAVRSKVAREELARRKRAALDLLKARVSMELWGVCKIQALFRGMQGRVRFSELIKQKKGKWKELFDPEKQRRFFYNKLTGEIRWRMPQDLLDLIPVPKCDNCGFYEASTECAVCNEVYCQQCWEQVHYGGRRKNHSFRALFDFYHKRIDYGDGGEFPSKWPSEIIQDEVQGWMLRVAPIRDPISLHVNGWEEYSEINQDGTVGNNFYFNRKTFEASYSQPSEVKEDLESKAAWERYYEEQNNLDFSADYGGFTAVPGSASNNNNRLVDVDKAVLARNEEARHTYSYDPYEHKQHGEEWHHNQDTFNHANYESHTREEGGEAAEAVRAQHQAQADLPPASSRSASGMTSGRLTGRVSMNTNPPPPRDPPPSSQNTSFMQTQLGKIGSTPRGTNPLMMSTSSMNAHATGGSTISSSARGKQELSQQNKRKAARMAGKILGGDPMNDLMTSGTGTGGGGGGGMMETGGFDPMATKSKPALVDRRTTPRD